VFSKYLKKNWFT